MSIMDNYTDSKYYINDKLAKYKNEEYIRLLSRLEYRFSDKVLKTDLYEEAHGKDEILLWIFDRCRYFLGIDISYDITNKARSALKYNRKYCFANSVQYIASDVRSIPFRDSIFDIVISPSTLDHFSEIEMAISEIYRVLKPGGNLIIAINNKFNPLFILGSWLSHILGLISFKNFYYSPKKIERILKTQNFFIKNKIPIVHIPFLFPTISNLIHHINIECLNKLDAFCIDLIRRYSSYNTVIHYFSAWFIAIIAEKY